MTTSEVRLYAGNRGLRNAVPGGQIRRASAVGIALRAPKARAS